MLPVPSTSEREGESETMSYPPTADPVFYDTSSWIKCKECEEEFDEMVYNSRTCSECETKQQEEENK